MLGQRFVRPLAPGSPIRQQACKGSRSRVGRVYINKDQYFAEVPEIAWGFHISGYQPAQKWLKDRRERSPSFDDITHYQRILSPSRLALTPRPWRGEPGWDFTEAMDSETFVFGDFSLDLDDRRLRRSGEPVELSSRYFDALALLVGEPGRLVSKARFMDEIWRGVPVTDEALTQCIRTLRRQLGDDAANPRFIETVPKHGYRFVAEVSAPGSAEAGGGAETSAAPGRWGEFWLTGAAGAIGGALAGLLGGLLYGFAATATTMGGTTLLLVLMALAAALGLAGGAGVAFGIAGAAFVPSLKWQWPAFGGMMGGIAVGALAKLFGLDALNLLFGHAPANMTGAPEGSLLGVALGYGAWASRDAARVSRGMAWGALTGGAAGALMPLLGGHLLGGSLASLARQFPDSHIRLDGIARFLGESGFGLRSQAVTGAIEGMMFGAGVVGALAFARGYNR